MNLVAACKDYEQKQGGVKELGGPGTAWRRWEARAYRVAEGGRAVGLRVSEAEALLPEARLFVLRVRHNGTIEDAGADTVIQAGDTVAVAGSRDVLVKMLGPTADEVEDKELLAMPVEGVDVLVSNRAVDGKTLVDLAQMPETRGVFLRKIVRGATATVIPILPNTTSQRGDVFTIAGRTQDTVSHAAEYASLESASSWAWRNCATAPSPSPSRAASRMRSASTSSRPWNQSERPLSFSLTTR